MVGGGIFHSSPMMSGVFPYVPSQKETEWKLKGLGFLFVYALQDGFWRGKLSSVSHGPLVLRTDFIVLVS